MKLKQKMIIGAVVFAIVPVLAVTALLDYLAVNSGREALEEQAKNQLVSIRNARKNQIESYLNTLRDQTQTLANDRMIIDAMTLMAPAFARHRSETVSDPTQLATQKAKLRDYYNKDFSEQFQKKNASQTVDMNNIIEMLDDDSVSLQYSFIANNSAALGQKDEMVMPAEVSSYARLHALYHPHIRNFTKTFGYYDVFLVEPVNGDIVYTMYKELDFSTSLLNGPYADTNLGHVVQKALKQSDSTAVVFADIERYLPSYNDQAMFIAAPIFNEGKRVGVLAFQMPVDRINDIMTVGRNWSQHGLANTGETYIVGNDKLMRSDSRFLIEDKSAYLAALGKSGVEKTLLQAIGSRNSSIGMQSVISNGVNEALAGRTGFSSFPDYRGIDVLSAYAPLDFLGTRWAILAEIDQAEAFSPTVILQNRIRFGALLLGSIIIAISIALAFYFVRAFSRPIADLEETVQAVAKGNYKARANVTTDDELGSLAGTLNKLLDDRIANLAESERQNEILNDSIIRLLLATQKLSERDLTVSVPVSEDVTGPLADAITQVSQAITDVLRRVRKVAIDVESASRDVQERAQHISQVSQQDLQALQQSAQQLVATAQALHTNAKLAEECRHITTAMTTISTTAKESVRDTISGMNEIRSTIHETEKRIKRLGERSQEINKVVNIINNIAERTHVLALNASMQAAVAGEEGRAFAVVADEVQRLAESARNATAQISSLVQTIHGETAETAETMGQTIARVVAGSNLAERAGVQMDEATRTGEKLREIVHSIADSCVAQASVSESLTQRSAELLKRAQDTQSELLEQNQQSSRLLENSRNLNASVQLFKLPDTPAASSDDQRAA